MPVYLNILKWIIEFDEIGCVTLGKDTEIESTGNKGIFWGGGVHFISKDKVKKKRTTKTTKKSATQKR